MQGATWLHVACAHFLHCLMIFSNDGMLSELHNVIEFSQVKIRRGHTLTYNNCEIIRSGREASASEHIMATGIMRKR